MCGPVILSLYMTAEHLNGRSEPIWCFHRMPI